jgi:hypothetical protein
VADLPPEPNDSDRLPDDAVVVRGGYMRNKSLKISAQVHCDETGGEYGWCFWCCPGKTADEIARDADFDADVIRTSTVGRIRLAGFEIAPDRDEDDHVVVALSGEPDSGVCKRLRDAFDEARPIGG